MRPANRLQFSASPHNQPSLNNNNTQMQPGGRNSPSRITTNYQSATHPTHLSQSSTQQRMTNESQPTNEPKTNGKLVTLNDEISSPPTNGDTVSLSSLPGKRVLLVSQHDFVKGKRQRKPGDHIGSIPHWIYAVRPRWYHIGSIWSGKMNYMSSLDKALLMTVTIGVSIDWKLLTNSLAQQHFSQPWLPTLSPCQSYFHESAHRKMIGLRNDWISYGVTLSMSHVEKTLPLMNHLHALFWAWLTSWQINIPAWHPVGAFPWYITKLSQLISLSLGSSLSAGEGCYVI